MSSSRVFDLIPAILSSISTTLQTWTTNSFTFPNFSNTCSFHSMSVHCFIFLACALLAISSFAFLYTPSASKGLQAAFALAQEEHDMAFLKTKLTNNPTPKKKNILTEVPGVGTVCQNSHTSHKEFLHPLALFLTPSPILPSSGAAPKSP